MKKTRDIINKEVQLYLLKQQEKELQDKIKALKLHLKEDRQSRVSKQQLAHLAKAREVLNANKERTNI